MNTHFIDTDGARIHVRADGQGAPVLFVAGLADDSTSWEPQLTALRTGHRVLAIDNRTVGKTESSDTDLTIATMSSDVLAVMDAFDVSHAHIVGNSMGGAIAQTLALTAPERVTSLVLSGTWCRSDALFRTVIRSWAAAARSSMDRAAFLHSLFTWCVTPATYAAGDVDEWVQAMASDPSGQTAEGFVAQCSALLDFDSADDLQRLTMPTMVIWGAEDRLVGERHSAHLIDGLSTPSTCAIAAAGHAVNLEQPDVYNQALVEFWGRL